MFQTILFVFSMVAPSSIDSANFQDDTGATDLANVSPAVAMLSDSMIPGCHTDHSVTMFAPAPALYMRTYDWTFSKAEMRQINAAFQAGASKVDVCLDGSQVKVR